jgi:hypothetical protein
MIDEGFIAVGAGGAGLTANGKPAEVPPAVTTEILVGLEGTRLAGTTAVTCVELMYVVASAVEFHRTTVPKKPEIKFVPLTVSVKVFVLESTEGGFRLVIVGGDMVESGVTDAVETTSEVVVVEVSVVEARVEFVVAFVPEKPTMAGDTDGTKADDNDGANAEAGLSDDGLPLAASSCASVEAGATVAITACGGSTVKIAAATLPSVLMVMRMSPDLEISSAETSAVSSVALSIVVANATSPHTTLEL